MHEKNRKCRQCKPVPFEVLKLTASLVFSSTAVPGGAFMRRFD